jgi:hypothetical protein
VAPKQGGLSSVLCRLWDFLPVTLHQSQSDPEFLEGVIVQDDAEAATEETEAPASAAE